MSFRCADALRRAAPRHTLCPPLFFTRAACCREGALCAMFTGACAFDAAKEAMPRRRRATPPRERDAAASPLRRCARPKSAAGSSATQSGEARDGARV